MRFLSAFLSTLRFNLPRRSDILVYDSLNTFFLREYLHSSRYTILHTRRERIYILLLPLCIFSSFFYKGNLFLAYLDACILYINPKLVVTGIDNCFHFYTISPRFQNTSTLFYQSSKRNIHRDIFGQCLPSSGLHVDFQLVYGDAIGSHYIEHVSGTSYSVGSVTNNAIPKRVIPKSQDSPRKILFVSQWHRPPLTPSKFICLPDGSFMSHSQYYRPDDTAILLLHKAVKSLDSLELTILTNAKTGSPSLPLEISHFSNLLDSQFSPSFLTPVSLVDAYQSLDVFDLVITVDSSLGYESLARGNRTAFISIRGPILSWPDAYFGWPAPYPPEGFCWTTSTDLKRIKTLITDCISYDSHEWAHHIQQLIPSLINYDADNSQLHDLLSAYI